MTYKRVVKISNPHRSRRRRHTNPRRRHGGPRGYRLEASGTTYQSRRKYTTLAGANRELAKREAEGWQGAVNTYGDGRVVRLRVDSFMDEGTEQNPGGDQPLVIKQDGMILSHRYPDTESGLAQALKDAQWLQQKSKLRNIEVGIVDWSQWQGSGVPLPYRTVQKVHYQPKGKKRNASKWRTRKRVGKALAKYVRGQLRGKNPAALVVKGRGWIQESYETGSPDLRVRAKLLRKLGYRVTSVSMGTQITQWGRVKMTLLDIRPGDTGDEYLEKVPPAVELRNPSFRKTKKRIRATFAQHYGKKPGKLTRKTFRAEHRQIGKVVGEMKRWKRAHNPQRQFQVRVPPSRIDPKGYDMTIKSRNKREAMAEARKWCAKTYHQQTGKPAAEYRLPKGTKIREVGKNPQLPGEPSEAKLLAKAKRPGNNIRTMARIQQQAHDWGLYRVTAAVHDWMQRVGATQQEMERYWRRSK